MEQKIDDVIKFFKTEEFSRVQIKEAIESCNGDKEAALQKLMLRSR